LRYAIFSDVHANLHALNRVLEDIEQHKVDRIICLGDLVGYGAFPNHVVDKVREMCDVVIAGNHDHAAINLMDISAFNEHAHRAAIWTRQKLSADNISWLKDRPMSKVIEDIQFVHASPINPSKWDYIFSKDDARRAMEKADASTVFVGHTHVPFDYTTRNGRIINVGSAGQPRDGDPRASYVIFDNDTGERRFVRVEYDVYGAKDAIILEGLPPFLAERLVLGR
jgi:putative phosphoesterase